MKFPIFKIFFLFVLFSFHINGKPNQKIQNFKHCVNAISLPKIHLKTMKQHNRNQLMLLSISEFFIFVFFWFYFDFLMVFVLLFSIFKSTPQMFLKTLQFYSLSPSLSLSLSHTQILFFKFCLRKAEVYEIIAVFVCGKREAGIFSLFLQSVLVNTTVKDFNPQAGL